MNNGNPFRGHKLHHYPLTYASLLDHKGAKLLDYGTGTAEFIGGLTKISNNLYAFDVDRGNVAEAKKKYPHVKFKYIPIGKKLPYRANSFDVVFMFHVLEHVDSEEEALSEIYRILKPGGTLYLASPYQGVMAWADTANLRYRFPKLHKWFMKKTLGIDEYERRFVEKSDQNLFGDCSANRRWHTHYKEKEIVSLLDRKFEIYKFHKFSFLHPFLLVIDNIWNFSTHKKNKFFRKLIHWDNCFRFGESSYNFLVVAKKK